VKHVFGDHNPDADPDHKFPSLVRPRVLSKFKYRHIPVLSRYLQASSVVVVLARMTTENQKLYYKDKGGI
jgi:hypothetical protein